MAIKMYTKDYAGMLPRIFEVKSHFMRTFGGQLQVKDGVKESDTFLELKISDADVVLQEYNTGANVAFGTGTGDSNRFGPRKEIKSVNAQVPYKAPMAIHEGVDNMTVNDINDEVVAERLALHAEAWVEYLNAELSKALSDNADDTIEKDLTEEGIIEAFNEARAHFTNKKINKSLGRVAYVTSEVYNFLVDHRLATTAKQSGANIDEGEIVRFKGFDIEELADEYFQGNENIYFAIDNVGIVGVGVEVTRAMDSEDFYGVALQGAGKYAEYLPEKNKVGILKAELATVPAG